MNPYVDPKSLDEMYEWNKKLTVRQGDGTYSRAGMVPWRGNWGAPGWMWTFGGQLVEVNGRTIKPTATLPKNIEAFKWLADWAQFFGTNNPAPSGRLGFQNGTVAMSTESSSVVNDYIAYDVPFTTGRVPHPAGGANGTWGGG